jgi:hypothetical protein
MNNKKVEILRNNIHNFNVALDALNYAYLIRNEIIIYKYPCLVEREATRLYTHFEDWTTINNDLHYKEFINNILRRTIKDLDNNLIGFIKEQNEIDGMMYYTYILLHSANIL